MLFTLLTIVLVIVVGAAIVWFLGQLPIFDPTLLQIARAVIYLAIGLYALLAVVGLLTGHEYVPVLRSGG